MQLNGKEKAGVFKSAVHVRKPDRQTVGGAAVSFLFSVPVPFHPHRCLAEGRGWAPTLLFKTGRAADRRTMFTEEPGSQKECERGTRANVSALHGPVRQGFLHGGKHSLGQQARRWLWSGAKDERGTCSDRKKRAICCRMIWRGAGALPADGRMFSRSPRVPISMSKGQRCPGRPDTAESCLKTVGNPGYPEGRPDTELENKDAWR